MMPSDPNEELRIDDMWRDIVAFHEKFRIAYDGGPRTLPEDLQGFRLQFLAEEFTEYDDAVDNKNLEQCFDALIDLVYVALGTAYLHGFNFPEGWDRVHKANMKKIRAARASQSKRSSIYDVIKPPGWRAPDLSDLVTPRETEDT